MNQIKKFMSSTKELQVQKKSSKNPINKGFLEPFECRRQAFTFLLYRCLRGVCSKLVANMLFQIMQKAPPDRVTALPSEDF